jgi:hypothetical protein
LFSTFAFIKIHTITPKIKTKMLKQILKTTGLKYGIYAGITNFAVLCLLVFSGLVARPFTIFHYWGLVITAVFIILGIYKHKYTACSGKISLGTGFLAGACVGFIGCLVSGVLMYLLMLTMPHLVQNAIKEYLYQADLLKYDIVADKYALMVEGIKQNKAHNFGYNETMKKLPLLFFVNILAAAYYKN